MRFWRKSKLRKNDNSTKSSIMVKTKGVYLKNKLRLYDVMLKYVRCEYETGGGDSTATSSSGKGENLHRTLSTNEKSPKKLVTTKSDKMISFTTTDQSYGENGSSHENLLKLSNLHIEKSPHILEEKSPISYYYSVVSTLPKKFSTKFSVAGYETLRLSQRKIFLSTIFEEDQHKQLQEAANVDRRNDRYFDVVNKVDEKKRWKKNKFAQSAYKSCPVCLDPMMIDQKLAKLPCKHYFHVACFETTNREDKICIFCQNPYDERRVSYGRCEVL